MKRTMRGMGLKARPTLTKETRKRSRTKYWSFVIQKLETLFTKNGVAKMLSPATFKPKQIAATIC